MAVARRAAGALATNSTTTITVPYPTNAVDDILLMTVSTASNVSTLSDTGWVLLASNTTATPRTYVYWKPVTTVQSGSVVVTTTANNSGRAIMSSYSGASTTQPSASAIKTINVTTATTAHTVPFAGDVADYVYVGYGRNTASTINSETASPGTWTASEVGDGSGTASVAVVDGPITGGTASTILSATSTAAVTYSAISVALSPVSTSVDFPGAPSLAGSGALDAGTPTPGASGTASTTGSGALGISTTVSTSGNASLAGTGTLSAGTPTPRLSQAAALTGSGALSVTVRPAPVVSTALSGSGALTVTTASTQGYAAGASLSGSGALTATPSKTTAQGAPALAGSGTLSLTAKAAGKGNATLSGNGSLSISTVLANTRGTAALTGTGTLSVAAGRNTTGTAALSGSGSLSVTALKTTAIPLTGSGSLSVTAGASLTLPDKTYNLPTVSANANVRNITGYSVQEDATPLDVSSTEGGVGTINFAMAADPNSIMMFDSAIELDDDYRGTTSGTITQVELSEGLNNVTADSRLGVLVGNTRALPMTGTFESVVRYYLSLGDITDGIYVDPQLSELVVSVQGWSGDGWLHLKQFCISNNVEIALVSNLIVFRPIRSIVLNPRRVTTTQETLAKDNAARFVEVNYYDNVWRDNVIVYPRTVEETGNATVYQVEAGQVIEDDIELSVSLESIVQPICVDDVTQDYDGRQSVYSVRGVDNSQITPQMWEAGGGKIELTINDDPTSVHIKITGSSDQYYGPYRIAGRVYEAPDLTSIITPPSSTVEAVPVTPPTEPVAPTEPKAPASNPTKPTKPVKLTAAEAKAAAAQAAYDKKKAAYDKAMIKYNAAVKAADVETKRREAEAQYINDMQQNERDYPSLRITGTGVHFNKSVLTLPTGVPDVHTAADTGVSVDSDFVDTVADAYTVGIAVAREYIGESHVVTATLTQVNQRTGSGEILLFTIKDFDTEYAGKTIADFNAQWHGKTIADFNNAQKALVVSNFENQVFGNVSGARFRRGNAMFRITQATTTHTSIDITAVRDTIIKDFNYVHSGQTIADFNALYAGLTLKQFAREPLLGG